ncbi:MAG TPA: sugar phosphate nucleotidyltransferase [Patescibacteria group bacterium]|nr:sugar phosphate nucleotidyltransferase [Patescibacteria group bacterium]
MQTVILCGGLGTRMKEETEFRPKAMVEVGGVPILWHIMRIYMHYGYNDFIIALGYKGEMIRELFRNWKTNMDDFSIDMASGKTTILTDKQKNFKVTLVNTDHDDNRKETLTGARIRRVAPYIKGEEFMLTYGDGVSDIDIKKVVDFHHEHGTLATVSGVHPKSRFGLVELDQKTGLVTKFSQQPVMREYISGGFMVFNSKCLEYFTENEMEEGLTHLADEKQLSMFTHEGFWKAVDTYKELEQLNQLWEGERPWAVWEKK